MRINWTIQKEEEEEFFSEGEEIIARFLDDEKIEWELVKTSKLEGDSQNYRKPDFYLPKFDMCIEFFGKWNVSPQEKERYREKKRVYTLNRIPCIYLYPENLGFLDQAFYLRIEEEMEAKDMKKEILKYKFFILKKEFGEAFLVSYLTGAFLFFWFTRDMDTDGVIAFREINLVFIGLIFLISLIEFLKIGWEFLSVFRGK